MTLYIVVQVSLVKLVQLVMPDQRAREDLQAVQDTPARPDLQEALEGLDLKVHKVFVESREHQDNKELVERLGPRVQ